jgi:hypothetical protein
MAAQLPHGKNSPWPRCRWCHQEIKPSTGEEMYIYNTGGSVRAWYHVATAEAQCKGRSNQAEPMPALQEEPFIAATYEFIDKHRKLRRAFREVSQSRASAMRRLNDYHILVDKIIDAQDELKRRNATDGTAAAIPLHEAVQALCDYRKSTQAAGWR